MTSSLRLLKVPFLAVFKPPLVSIIFYSFFVEVIADKILINLQQHLPLLMKFCLWDDSHRNSSFFCVQGIFWQELSHFLQLLLSQRLLLDRYGHSCNARCSRYHYPKQIEILVFFMILFWNEYMKSLILMIVLTLYAFIIKIFLILLDSLVSTTLSKFVSFSWFLLVLLDLLTSTHILSATHILSSTQILSSTRILFIHFSFLEFTFFLGNLLFLIAL